MLDIRMGGDDCGLNLTASFYSSHNEQNLGTIQMTYV